MPLRSMAGSPQLRLARRAAVLAALPHAAGVGDVRRELVEADEHVAVLDGARLRDPHQACHLAPQPRCVIEGRGKSVQKYLLDPINI